MSSRKPIEEKAALDQPVESQNRFNLEREVVLDTLFHRVTKDCLEAQSYLSITDIVGVLEMIKLSIYSSVHMEISKNLSENYIGKNTQH